MKIELTHSNSETFPSQTKILPVRKVSHPPLPPSHLVTKKIDLFIIRTDTDTKSQLIFLMIEALRYNNFLFNFLELVFEYSS